jgi:hypothetical protein
MNCLATDRDVDTAADRAAELTNAFVRLVLACSTLGGKSKFDDTLFKKTTFASAASDGTNG